MVQDIALIHYFFTWDKTTFWWNRIRFGLKIMQELSVCSFANIEEFKAAVAPFFLSLNAFGWIDLKSLLGTIRNTSISFRSQKAAELGRLLVKKVGMRSRLSSDVLCL